MPFLVVLLLSLTLAVATDGFAGTPADAASLPTYGCAEATSMISKIGTSAALTSFVCIVSHIRSQVLHKPPLHRDAKLTAAAADVLAHQTFAVSQVQSELERVGYIVHGHPWAFARCIPEMIPAGATPVSLANQILSHEAFVWGPSYDDIGVVISGNQFYGLGGFSDAPGH